MSGQVSQRWRDPYEIQKDELNLSGWRDRKEHWMLTAQHVQKEAGNIHQQSSVTEVLDRPKVNYHLYDWARLVNALFSLPCLDTKTSSKVSKEGMKE